MTRKQYINKGQQLILAIYKHPQSLYPEGQKIGEHLKHFKKNAKSVPEKFGSYEAAWNCDIMKWARENYLG